MLRKRPHLVILDRMLPGPNGLSICRHLRPAYIGLILMLTARDTPTDQRLGLELGTDDDLTKPTRPRMLLARSRALLRRDSSTSSRESERLRCGDLRIDPRARKVRAREVPIAVGSAEFEHRLLLAMPAGRSAESVWAKPIAHA